MKDKVVVEFSANDKFETLVLLRGVWVPDDKTAIRTSVGKRKENDDFNYHSLRELF